MGELTIRQVPRQPLRMLSRPNYLYQHGYTRAEIKTNPFRVCEKIPSVISRLAWHSGRSDKHGPGKTVLVVENSKAAHFVLLIYMVLLVLLI
jgi:hypothetical protein